MKIFYTLSTATLLALTACGDKTEYSATPHSDTKDSVQMEQSAMLESGTFNVVNTDGFTIGSVTITDTAKGVTLGLNVTAMPEGKHAIHFHENGLCDGPDFKSAGGHYNPAMKDHGFDVKAGPHAGDMRNFDAPVSGVVKTELMNERVAMSNRGKFAPLLDSNGTALIIHAVADDYKSQPSGAAGARIACAVISR